MSPLVDKRVRNPFSDVSNIIIPPELLSDT